MSERERHSKRRTRQEDVPDPDDRYDPRQGAKRSRKEDLSPDLGLLPIAYLLTVWHIRQLILHVWLAGPPRRPVREDLNFSDR